MCNVYFSIYNYCYDKRASIMYNHSADRIGHLVFAEDSLSWTCSKHGVTTYEAYDTSVDHVQHDSRHRLNHDHVGPSLHNFSAKDGATGVHQRLANGYLQSKQEGRS